MKRFSSIAIISASVAVAVSMALGALASTSSIVPAGAATSPTSSTASTTATTSTTPVTSTTNPTSVTAQALRLQTLCTQVPSVVAKITKDEGLLKAMLPKAKKRLAAAVAKHETARAKHIRKAIARGKRLYKQAEALSSMLTTACPQAS